MNKLLVTYDLCGQNKNYDGLIMRLRLFYRCLKINKSSWLIVTRLSCNEVVKELSKHIDHNDMLFVAKCSNEASWTKAESQSSEIKKVLESYDR